MLHEESLITSLFKIFNVVVLFGVVFYFFKTRLVISIREMIAQKIQEEKALQNEKRVLKAKLKTIEDEIIEQQLQCAKIKENVSRWNGVIADEQKAVEQQQRTRTAEQEARIKRQTAYLAALKMQQKVLPQALSDAQRELEEQFASHRGHDYLNYTLRHMRKV